MGRKGVSNDGKRYKIEILCARARGGISCGYENAFIPQSFRLHVQRSLGPMIWSDGWLGSAELGQYVYVS